VGWLDQSWISNHVAALRPDYSVLLIVADRLRPGPSDEMSEAALASAEHSARQRLGTADPSELPHVAQWRDAYRQFGAKPQRTRPSIEGLLRRVDAGLPRIDRLTDIYNAVSLEHVLPCGGGEPGHHVCPPGLPPTHREKTVGTNSDGPAAETCQAGEVIWRDDLGATCRRWNWRQCLRTRLGPATTRAVFILDSLAAMGSAELGAAGAHLTRLLHETDPSVLVTSRRLTATPAGP